MYFKITFLFLLVSLSGLVKAQEDSSKFLVVQEFKIIGNKTSKEKIILREMPFKLGDKLSKKQLDELVDRAKSNLLNTLLFNFVTVDVVYFDKQNVSIYIMVEERWYWWPIPILEIQETNFNTWWQTKDFDKINFGGLLIKENFRGRKERFSIKLQGGYTEEVGASYAIPYANKAQTQGLKFRFNLRRNHELAYANSNNKRDFYKSNSDYVQNEKNVSLAYEIRPKLYNNHSFQMGYGNVSVTDTVATLNDNYLNNGASQMEFLSLSYRFKRDKRNFRSYPTIGYYYDASILKNGAGVFNEDLNQVVLGSQVKKYWQLSNKLYFSGLFKTKFTLNEGPYYLQRGLGFVNDLVRGYELYVVNGQHYSITKAQLRYAVLDNKIFKVNAIKWEKFNKVPLSIFAGAFFDSGYVVSNHPENNNSLTNTALFGAGLSLDFVSYYDLVLRTEYSINKLGEHGLFIHFVAPI